MVSGNGGNIQLLGIDVADLKDFLKSFGLTVFSPVVSF